MIIKIQIKRLNRIRKNMNMQKPEQEKNVKQLAKSIDVVVVHQQHTKERINL